MRNRLIVLAVLILTIPCSAATFTIKADGTGDYPTIQEAIDAASLGDTVSVAGGTYNENISSASEITIHFTGTATINGQVTTGIGTNIIADADLTINSNGDITLGGNITVGGKIAVYTDDSGIYLVGPIHIQASELLLSTVGDINIDDPATVNGSVSVEIYAGSDITGTDAITGGSVIIELTGSMPIIVAGTIYVDKDAIGSGDGSSWEDALINLQSALNVAMPGNEIWVAAGTYYPSVEVGGSGDRYNTFQMKNGVTIKGGFAGYGTSDPNDRDVELYETILSGDLNGDDAVVCEPPDLRSEPTRAENSYHVVTGSGTDKTAVLDGFTITAACGAPYGGGMCNEQGSPMVNNCIFVANSGSYNGSGGGMCNIGSSPTVTNCAFIGNAASWPGGGGMANYNGSNPILTNCVFIGNTANSRMYNNGAGEGDGGGMVNWEDSSPTLINCAFIGNSASNCGGAMDSGGNYTHTVSSPKLINCTFVGNSAGDRGGGMYQGSGYMTLTNCIMWDNTAELGNAMYLHEGYQVDATVTISYSDIEGGQSGFYIEQGCTLIWGDGNIDSNPLFADVDGADNAPGTEDDNLRLLVGSPCIDAGDNSVVTVDTDLDGKTRIVNGTVDMGAYEHQPPRVIYVDTDAVGANDGSSWEDAFGTYFGLQMALAVASSGDQIRVAQGLYKPDITNGIVPPSRSATFQLKSGVTIEGGYAGFGEPDPDARDVELYETILSGDLDGDDEDFNPNGTNNDENSYHVVTGTNTNETAILDGFTITAGNAEGVGGYPGYHNCGGGMYNYEDASPTLTNCTFRRNRARGWGGGMYNRSTSNLTHPTLTNCTFNGNYAKGSGGAIMFHIGNAESTTVLTNCIFSGNSAGWFGGGIDNIGSDLILNNCTFVDNWVEWDDGTCGALRITENSRQTITNCIFWANLPNQIGGDDDGWIRVTHSDIQDGWQEWYDEDKGNIDVDPLFVDADGLDNIAGTEDDNLRLLPWSPCIDAGDNSVVTVDTDLDGKPRITNGIVDMGAYEAPVSIEADVHIVPRVINRRSRMKRVMAIMRLSEGVGRHDIADEALVLYPDGSTDGIEAIWQRVIGWGRRESVFALFDKAELMDAVQENGRVELTVVGRLESGQYIYGSDTVRIVQPHRRRARGLRRR